MTSEVAARESAPPTAPTGESETPRDLAQHLPLLLFACVEAGAFVYYLALARTQWFFSDEWEFLAGRSLSVHDLLEQHGGQLVALPLVVYRALFAIVGLRSYLPYQAVVVVLHITTAWLLRVVMRRSGVQPWIATAAASLFLFFGAEFFSSQPVRWDEGESKTERR